MINSTFAVVDLETTGTSLTKDKIIQFACVIIDKGKVVNQISIDVNPGQVIPLPIQKLTGITNEQVAKAPFFEEVALMIKNLLSDCVFVAHNAYFDFSFLNSEFSRLGITPLASDVLDTVELAQVFFPLSNGYRVQDLSQYLNISHENPHEALSDALATGDIFLNIIAKINAIPLITLEQIVKLSCELGVQNSKFLAAALRERCDAPKKVKSFDYEIEVVGDLALRVKDDRYLEKSSLIAKDYPQTLAEKTTFFEAQGLQLRAPQVQMMDSVTYFLNEADYKNELIEMPTGAGKTLGYLLPLLKNKTPNKPVVISTSTLILQNQMLHDTLPMAQKLLGYPFKGLVLKSFRHYLDLDKFVLTLKNPVPQKQYALYQMAVLVWLLETETGDLEEIQINKKHLFYNHVHHDGHQDYLDSSPFVEHDFWFYLMRKKTVSDCIIVNHAFLCEEDHRREPLLTQSKVLVIDEAHKLMPTLEQKNQKQISLTEIYYLVKVLKETSAQLARSNDHRETCEQLNYFQLFAEEFKEWYEDLENVILNQFIAKHKGQDIHLSEIEDQFSPELKRAIKTFNLWLNEFQSLLKKFEMSEFQFQENSKLQLVKIEHQDTIERLLVKLQMTAHFFNYLAEGEARWFSQVNQNLVLNYFNFNAFSIEQTSWYQNFDKVLFTGGTLQIDSDSNFFEKRLGLSQLNKSQALDLFDYKKQAKLLLLDEKIDFGNEKKYIKKIAETVEKTYRAVEESVLVLFTSHDILKGTYHTLNAALRSTDVELLAQDITGSNEKIIKRASQNEKCIILGAASFWDGIEIPNQHYKLVVMTKIPFDPPTRPMVKAYYDYLEAEGKNPFYEEALPQAGMRMRQGLGRLLRKETDHGVMIVLDQRLTEAKYGAELQKYLPQELPIELCSISEMVEEIAEFYKKK